MANASVTLDPASTPEKPIFNFVVPQGERGLPGPKGDKGDTGAKGDPGDTGATGTKGADGRPGATGAKGDKGDPGSAPIRIDETAGRAAYAWDALNEREQLIYGDTGWRDVRGLVSGLTTAATLLIRRTGRDVALLMGSLVSNSSTLVLPKIDGFMPSQPVNCYVADGAGVVQARLYAAKTATYLNPSGSSTSASAQQVRWITDDAWPTSLPGVAMGAIPNL